MAYTTRPRPTDAGTITTLASADLVTLQDGFALQRLENTDNYTDVSKPADITYDNLVIIGFAMLQENGDNILQENGDVLYWTQEGLMPSGYTTVTRPPNE